MRAFLSDSDGRLDIPGANAVKAVSEAERILAETESRGSDGLSTHHCVRVVPFDIRTGWFGREEREALAEALGAFVYAPLTYRLTERGAVVEQTCADCGGGGCEEGTRLCCTCRMDREGVEACPVCGAEVVRDARCPDCGRWNDHEEQERE